MAKSILISHNDVINKQFRQANKNGYDAGEVDNFLDIVVEQLIFYEDNYKKYIQAINNVELLKQKSKRDEETINKFRNELDELYDNGYSNKIFMKRLTDLESGQEVIKALQQQVKVLSQNMERFYELIEKIYYKKES